MRPEKICEQLQHAFGDALTSSAAGASHPHATVAADRWVEVAEHLRDEPSLKFNLLRCISAFDLLADNKLAAVYDLHAIAPPPPDSKEGFSELLNEFAVRIEVDRDDPHIPSVARVWPAAEWHEREAYDMMGIVFENHPDSVEGPEGRHPRRILCPDDWVGFPLRKDYEFPMEYHGIPAVTEYGQTRPVPDRRRRRQLGESHEQPRRITAFHDIRCTEHYTGRRGDLFACEPIGGAKLV